jgi:hypothetical protein
MVLSVTGEEEQAEIKKRQITTEVTESARGFPGDASMSPRSVVTITRTRRHALLNHCGWSVEGNVQPLTDWPPTNDGAVRQLTGRVSFPFYGLRVAVGGEEVE